MSYIRQKETNTVVITTGFLGDLSTHPAIVNNSDVYEVAEGTPDEGCGFVDYTVPMTVTRRQLKLQLFMMGTISDDIDNLINSLPEPDKSIALIQWQEAYEFDRNNELLVSMALLLGMTESQLDQIFINAKKL